MNESMHTERAARLMIHRHVRAPHQWERALDDIMHAGLDPRRVKQARRILIKVCWPTAVKALSAGALTRSDLVRGVVERLLAIHPQVEILVIEARRYTPVSQVWESHPELVALAQIPQVHLVDLDAVPLVKMTSPKFRKLGIVCLPETLLDYDLMINLAVPSHHIHEHYVGAWYNLLTLLSDESFRKRLHPYVGPVLADLSALFSPDLTILDARIFQAELGPVQGLPVRYDVLISGTDAMSVDAAGARLIGADPKRIPHLRAVARRLGQALDSPTDLEAIPAPFIAPLQYRLWRLSLVFARLGDFTQRLAQMIQLGSFALLASGFTDIVTGRWIAIPNILRTVKSLVWELNMLPDLTGRRITINKHIKDQTVS